MEKDEQVIAEQLQCIAENLKGDISQKIVNPDGIEAAVAIDVRQACITVTNDYESKVWGYNFGEVVK